MAASQRFFAQRPKDKPIAEWVPRDDIGGSLAILAVILAAIASGVYFLLPF
jgi:hypothetical protein